MNWYEKQENSLIWRNKGETLKLTPWGKDSLRVQAVQMGDLTDNRFALLEPEQTDDVEIRIEGDKASIRAGKLTARLEVEGWTKRARISFYNQKDELLLQEISEANALCLRSRKWEPYIGGDNQLTVSFVGQDDEHIYGMGQYQEEILDWKGCTMELAHRNSQASVPFYISSRGYGFLWHNPAIGQVSFGTNRMSWHAEST